MIGLPLFLLLFWTAAEPPDPPLARVFVYSQSLDLRTTCDPCTWKRAGLQTTRQGVLLPPGEVEFRFQTSMGDDLVHTVEIEPEVIHAVVVDPDRGTVEVSRPRAGRCSDLRPVAPIDPSQYTPEDFDVRPVALSHRVPPLSGKLREWRVRGQVMVKALVAPDGSVQQVCIESSEHPLLEEPALAAVRDWTFRPGRQRGIPVDVWVLAPVQFNR